MWLLLCRDRGLSSSLLTFESVCSSSGRICVINNFLWYLCHRLKMTKNSLPQLFLFLNWQCCLQQSCAFLRPGALNKSQMEVMTQCLKACVCFVCHCLERDKVWCNNAKWINDVFSILSECYGYYVRWEFDIILCHGFRNSDYHLCQL